MKTTRKILLSTWVAIALQTMAAQGGGTYWVATPAAGGDDANAGSEQAPFATLDAALAAARDGDTVRVRAGTYPIPAQTLARSASSNSNSRPSWWVTNAVSIIGDGPGATIFDGGDTAYRYAFLIDNAGASLSGVTVTRVKSNVAVNLQESGQIHVQNGVVSNCVVRDCSGLYVGAFSSRYGLVVDCVASNVTCSDSQSMGAGFVVQGWMSQAADATGVISNCQAYACQSNRGAGIYLASPASRAYNCLVTGCQTIFSWRDNAAVLFLAASGALASHCVVTNNVGINGGGVRVAGGTLRNCLVAFNRNSRKAGGGGVSITSGTIDSCTIVQNANEFQTTDGSVAGAHGLYQTGGTVINSIIAFNGDGYRIYDQENHLFTGGACTYTCTYPEAAGTGNSVVDPVFADRFAGDFRLSESSVLFDVSSEQGWMAGAVDLDGNPRISGTAPNPGAYEGVTPEHPPFLLTLEVSPISVVPGVPVAFAANPHNASGPDVSYRWEVGGVEISAAQSFEHAFATAGVYAVRCIGTSGGVTVTNDLDGAIRCDPTTVYVSNTGTGTWPCDTPATATNDLAAAAKIVMAPPGGRGTVHVLDGTYYPSSLISIDGGAVHVIGTNAVFWATEMDDMRYGILYLDAPDCIVSGLTFGGCTAPGKYEARNYGACLTIVSGVVSNCVVTDNYGSGWAGAAVRIADGLFTHGVIRNNVNRGDVGSGGGGRAAFSIAGAGTIAHTAVTNNTGNQVGGGEITAAGVVAGCVLRGNKATQSSIYSRAGAIYVNGAGRVVDTLVDGCEYRNASDVGGTVFLDHASAVLRNCLVTGATNALNPVVRLDKGTVESCTVAGNVINASTDGVSAGILARAGTTLRNTISWDNTADGAAANLCDAGASVTACLFAEPHFFADTARRYRLRAASPARNAGTFQDWMAGAKDLAGNPRVLHGAVDIGCYECTLSPGTVLSMR